jgi:hypothetical protein
MIFRVKKAKKKETTLKFLKGSLFSLLFFLISLKSYTQDSLSEVYWELSKGNRKFREL